jgi:serine/threonine-protein kinase
MLAGLAHAHSMGVLHRDLKPSNLLLLDDGRAALTDFGVAEDVIKRVYVDPRIYTRHMAPEVATGGSSSPQSDVWVASCTWYRLVSGAFPFDSVAEALTSAPVPAHRRNPQVPIAVSRAIATGLALDPADRYADAQRMHAAVAGLRVVNSWQRVDDPEAIEAWFTSTRTTDYEIRLVNRPRVGLELTARRDLRRGGGSRTVKQTRPRSLPRARQEMRGWLVRVVEGGSLA